MKKTGLREIQNLKIGYNRRIKIDTCLLGYTIQVFVQFYHNNQDLKQFNKNMSLIENLLLKPHWGQQSTKTLLKFNFLGNQKYIKLILLLKTRLDMCHSIV